MTRTVVSNSPHFGDAAFTIRDTASGDMSAIQHVWEQDDYNLRHLCKMPFGGIIDVGAHIGTFTLAASRAFPDLLIVGLEPNPVSFQLAVRNTIEISKLRQAVVIHQAAIRYDTDTAFIDRSLNSGGGHFQDGINPAIESNCDILIEVNTVRLEHFTDVSDNLLLKLDCEGSEFNILAGMTPRCKERIKCVIGEYHCVGGRNQFERAFVDAFPNMILTFGHVHGRFGDLELGHFFAFRP